MIILMSFTAVHTTWAFHYCGNHLHSVGIAGSSAAKSCCCEQNEDDAACQLTHTSCCSNQTLEIATDNFVQSQNSVSIGTDMVFPVLFCEIYSLPGCANFNTSASIPVFPPGSPAKYGIDLLTFICIFRI
jgi:hypothetical protein